MGIHCGEAWETVAGLVGLEVHRAARIAAAAHGEQILLSAAAGLLVRDSLPPGASLRDLGTHRLKDLGRPEEIFQLEAEGLALNFAPLRSLDNPVLQNNLPAQLASFVGRSRELAEVQQLVESTRLVTLTGAGGCGKTRLSLQVAAEMLDGSGDGVWLVELASVSDEGAVPSTICTALDIASRPDQPVLEALLDALAPQNMVIVLDNCEHLISECARVADAILKKCARVHLLATSREPLGIGGETIYRVPSMSIPKSDEWSTFVPESFDAIALFIDRVRAQGVELRLDEHNGRLVVSICRRLDGMPLAIELAAARLRSLSLESVNDRLDRRFRLLTGGSRSALPRQQTLRATIDWSFALLTRTEQTLLCRLSVFAEGFDLAAAENVCRLGDIEDFEVTDLLSSLVDKSLVVAEQYGGAVRYRLLETIRQFSAERLVEVDEQQALQVADAHREYFLSFAELAAPHLCSSEQVSWIARLDADQANVRRAMEHASNDPEGTAQALRFCVALARYWWVRSRSEEGISICLPVIDLPEAREDPALLASAMATLVGAVLDHDVSRALQLGQEAVGIARLVEDDRLLSKCLRELSSACYFAGQTERGLPLAQESVELSRKLADDVLLAESLRALLFCEQFIPLVTAEGLYAEAIACTEQTGDLFMGMTLHNNAGNRALREGNLLDARSHLERAARLRDEIGATISDVSLNLGWVLREEGDTERAVAHFEEALRVSRRSGARRGIAYACLGLACVQADLGDLHRGAILHGVAQAFLDQVGDPWQEPEKQYRQASIDGARARLGDEAFQRAYAEGEGLAFDAAINLALGRPLTMEE